jgi:MprA protease rhombosortase-interaction domain-containing protein
MLSVGGVRLQPIQEESSIQEPPPVTAGTPPVRDIPAPPPPPAEYVSSGPVPVPAEPSPLPAESEEKPIYPEENANISDKKVDFDENIIYNEESSSGIVSLPQKSRLMEKISLTAAVVVGAVLVITAGLFGFCLRRRRNKGAKKGEDENKL